VESSNLKMRQRDALVAAQRLALQMSAVSLSSPAQAGQLRPDGTLALPDVADEQYLVFSLLEREFAFKAEHIQGVERLADITPVPHVASWVKGVMNLRGSIASVVDLRTFLGMEPLSYNPRTRLLSVQYNEMLICLAVDRVSEMLLIPDAALNEDARQADIPHWASSYAAGIALLPKRVIVLLDAPRLLFSDKMQRYAALE